MLSTITLGSNVITVVAVPTAPGFASIELTPMDAVAIVSSPFTGQTQAFKWPGADMWKGVATMPKLQQKYADPWVSFLMQLRGRANGFLIGDPLKPMPAGLPTGLPQVDGSITVAAGSEVLYTKGWKASSFRNLLAGDYLQLGYRLHRVLDVVNADPTGKAAINIWPSLREVPTDGEPLILKNPRGLFRRASNEFTFSSSYERMTDLSFQIMEYR